MKKEIVIIVIIFSILAFVPDMIYNYKVPNNKPRVVKQVSHIEDKNEKVCKEALRKALLKLEKESNTTQYHSVQKV